MATTIKQDEGVPASYPPAPRGLSTKAKALSTAVVWQRIESYIAWRWTSRTIQWVVEGPGEWTAPLAPATISTVESWSDRANVWETPTPVLDPSPLGGFWLRCTGPYRFTGTVGDGSVPENVNEAYRRLAEYMAADPGTPGAASEHTEVPGVLTTEVTRVPSWMARALANSGAADLLRPYRRA